MKTFSKWLLLLLTLSMLVSCVSNNKNGGGVSTEEPPKSEVSLWMSHSYNKFLSNSKAPEDATNEYTVYMAKYESEGVQIALRSSRDSESFLRIRVLSGDNEYITYNMFHVKPVLKKGRNEYTDPCAPIGQGSKFKLEKNTTMAILFDFTTTADTPAGDYVYEIAIVDNKKNVYAQAKITVHVWDFEMPVEHKFETACGNLTVGTPSVNSYLDDSYFQYDVMHYEMLLQHNLSGYIVPGNVLDERSDKWMSDPRVTSFRISYGAENFLLSDEAYEEMYNKLMSNPEWAKKAMFYPCDEPNSPERIQEFEEEYKYVLEHFPGIRTISPFYTNLQVTDEMDQVDFMAQYINLHCPKFAMWNDEYACTPDQVAKYGSFEDRMKALQEKGDTVWAYVCNEPVDPYLNVHIDDDGLESRVLFWQFYQRDIDGFLYYGSTYWSEDPWHDVERYGVYGDGLLIYPGDEVGYNKFYPIPSIRLKIIRDGIDDIELMYIAEELLGREWVDSIVDQASSSITSVDVTHDEFYDLRVALGNAVEAELNK